KLRWVNKEHLKRMPKEQLAEEIKTHVASSQRARDLGWNVTTSITERLAPVLVERINTFGDIATLIDAQDLDYYFQEPTYDALSLKWKEDADLDSAKKHLTHIKSELSRLPDRRWTEEGIKAAIWPYAEKEGRGHVLWPFRFALSGKDRSPNPFTLSAILGKESALHRIDEALAKASAHASS
ncbi:MAG TPA: hypothetical protein VFT82_04380, partial [Candidatus Paceibacterota bacterium]|nr:hypothetical protein [Candidatus Paceibacterota bacterium]